MPAAADRLLERGDRQRRARSEKGEHRCCSTSHGRPPDIDHQLPENFWTISRIWNLSEDLKPQTRAPVAPEILGLSGTPARPKESCTSEPGTRMGPKIIRAHPTPRTAPKPP